MTMADDDGASAMKAAKAKAAAIEHQRDDLSSTSTGTETEEDAMPRSSIRWRGVLALLGGFLIQLTLGSFYSFGNMMTYMTSYMR